MSQRVKRPNRCDDGSVPAKRRKRTAAEEEEAASLAAAAGATWPTRSTELKSIYNRTTTEAPAELFRKDLISAMKLPDSEPLASDEYWVIVDQWKQEWERGVQVPVNPDSLPEPSVTMKRCGAVTNTTTSAITRVQNDFKLPKNKYIRITKDENFNADDHVLSHTPAQAEAACSYDLDECDVSWLKILNGERASSGLCSVKEDHLERVIERFELCCWDKIQSILRNEEGLGIEYDENVICDVCRSPDSEEGNEMVFCDSCNICVHQACYGITRIPEGQWLCCTCNLRKRPECVLCPNKGGAMKSTRSGQKWAHVSCALWIPEVSIGCVEKMEPITKISSIPQSRWALICVLCRERVGACIQCSVKTCKTAYHVTCAFKHGLEMRAIIEDENADDGVKLRSYCEKHSKSSKKEKSICSGSEDDDCKRKKRKDMTSEEKNQARAVRLLEIEAEFFKHVTVNDVTIHLDIAIDNEALQSIYSYWKLKRKAGHNKPLLPPRSEDVDMLSHKREQADLEKMKMFVQLRQDLERVRNLCYMVNRREKLSRTFFRMREQTFHKQVAVLDTGQSSLPNAVIDAVVEANHGPSIYDRSYSHNEAEDHTADFDTILARIAGIKSPSYSGDENKTDVNGLFKDVKNNPYKKVYVNGASKRRSMYDSGMSDTSSNDDKPKDNKENRLQSSSEEDKSALSAPNKVKKAAPVRKPQNNARRQKKRFISRSKINTSSEDDEEIMKDPKKDWKPYSRSKLSQVEKELGVSGTDSDELEPIKHKTDNQKTTKAISSIYSDTESSDVSMRDSNSASDLQNKLRTKAAVKEFIQKPSTSKGTNKESPDNKKKSKLDEAKTDTQSKKKDYVPSDLIVPQRQAAKKATENLKSNTRTKEHATATTTTNVVLEEPVRVEKEDKSKVKASKAKPTKETVKESPKEEEKLEKIKEKDVKEKKKDKDREKDKEKEKDKDPKSMADVFDIEKDIDKTEMQEILAYVPQRQAAKKAAEHIKSGLGKPTPASTTDPPSQGASQLSETDKVKEKEKEKPEVKTKKDDVKKTETKTVDSKKETESAKQPAKVAPDRKRKSSTNSSSTSSSSTSSTSDSSSSSSSDSEEEPAKPQPRSESLFSAREQTKRSSAKDWPFLDKGPRPAATSGSSSSSDSSAPSTPRKTSPTRKPSPTATRKSSPIPKSTEPTSRAATETSSTSSRTSSTRKSIDKKRPTTSPSKREEQSRPRGRGRAPRGRPRTSNSGDRIGDADVRSRDLSDGQRSSLEGERNKSRKGKQQTSRDDEEDNKTSAASNKETADASRKLLSPFRKQADKKQVKDLEVSNLEKEILERKAGKEGTTSKAKSTLDRLFGTPEKVKEKPDKVHVEKERSSRRELLKSPEKKKLSEKPLIAPEKLIIPSEKLSQADKNKSVLEKETKPMEKPVNSLEPSPILTDAVTKPLERLKSPGNIPLLCETTKPDKDLPSIEKPNPPLLTEKDKSSKESLIRSPNKELKQQIEKKAELREAQEKKAELREVQEKKTELREAREKKEELREAQEKKTELRGAQEKKAELTEAQEKNLVNKKLSKTKTIDDIFASKLTGSEMKENKIEIKKPPTPKMLKPSDEITIADKIVDDHVQSQKANELYNHQHNSIITQEMLNTDIAKTLLNELEAEKKNALKPPGVTTQVLQNRSIFSPQPHVKDASDFLDFNFDEIGIPKDDEITKGSLTWNFTSSNIVREDTKEESARETLNLVEKLRMTLSKKSTGCEIEDATTSNDLETDRIEFPEQVVPDTALNKTNVLDVVPNLNVDAKLNENLDPMRPLEDINKALPIHIEPLPQDQHQPEPDYSYLNCDTNVSLEASKNIPIQQHEGGLKDHTGVVQGDERWVPPSENYPGIPPVDPATYLNENVPLDRQYLEQYTPSAQEHHKKQQHQQQHLDSIPCHLDIRLQDDCSKNQSPCFPDRIDRRISQTPLMDPASMDCISSPMPYTIHPGAKWADCEVMPNRRSSSSSADSTSSSGSRRDEEESRLPDVRMVNSSTTGMELGAYLPSQVPAAFPPNPLDNFGGYSDGSFPPVSLFNPTSVNTQLPFPTSGAGTMFPPPFGAPFPNSHAIPPIPKPVEEPMAFPSPCTAAFTSSQHNMALTAAMVNLPPSIPKPIEQQLEEQLLVPPIEPPVSSQSSLTPSTTNEDVVPSPVLSNTTPTANSTLPSPSTSLKSNSSAGKKSPSKPTRSSARVTSQLLNKSPAKSPAKSPRQETALKQSGPGRGRSGDSKRGSGKSGASRGTPGTRSRGRGRGRGRGSHHNDYDYIGSGSGTIHNKLVGTVYDLDFDDDMSNDNMTDLKSMRERRKSIDVHDRKFEPFSSTRDSPRSPKFSSPSQSSHKSRSYNADLRDLRPPTPIDDSRSKTDISLTSSDNEPPQMFPDVTPLLPGPVDMRTYNSSFDQQTYNENLLGAFESGTADNQIQEIDEDFEKDLQVALTAKKPVDPPTPETSASHIKVSLSDSRNQLKVKIKGPIANYTSTVAPLPAPTVDPIVVTNVNSVSNNAINSASLGMPSGGTSNLRRMRKKELLRQYWTQDMNMDEQSSNPGYTAPAAPPLNRTIITIPKAVASMTSIPTKEDYRDYRTDTDDLVEAKQLRKESKARPGGLSRELRQLVDLSSDNDMHLERRRSVGSVGSNNSGTTSFDSASTVKVRRGRPVRPSSQPQQPQQPTAPKLKIKIGNNTNSVITEGEKFEDRKDRIRPPKKRLAVVEPSNTFNVEDLKRESMKFRKMMIKDLKIKHKKKDKSEKKKKKKPKPEVQIVESENPTKLIIRFGGSKKFESSGSTGDSERRTSGDAHGRTEDSNSNNSASDRLKEAKLPESNKKSEDKDDSAKPPLKLKLARCQEGTGYIMKPATSVSEKAEETQAVQPGQPPPNDKSNSAADLPNVETTPAVVQTPLNETSSTPSIDSKGGEVR